MSELFIEPNSSNAFKSEDSDDIAEKFNELQSDIDEKFEQLSLDIKKLTGAVNQFGGMLDHMVQQVAGFGQAVQKQGLSGILGMLSGGRNE